VVCVGIDEGAAAGVVRLLLLSVVSRLAGAAARMGNKYGGGRLVTGVRSCNTERNSERLMLAVVV
jgi:hypothetical protein